MVATTTVSQAAKRKKTADMPDSPPKRVTRARAKATTDPAPNPKTTKITTASVKAVAEKKQAIEPGKPIKRKTRADDEHDEPVQEPLAKNQPKSKHTKAGTRGKKILEATGDAVENVEPMGPPARTRGRQPKVAIAEEQQMEVPKSRGRVRKAVAPGKTAPSDANEPTSTAEPIKRTTRGRAASAIVATSTVLTVSKPLAAKKKVKFQEELEKDKENVPIQAEAPKAKNTATGLKAKPARKPPAARSTTRGRKAIEQTTQTKGTTQEVEALPLSPKKIKQIAKSSSISSEDELCGEKTPIRALSVSPVKPSMSLSKPIGKGVLDLDLKPTGEPVSPMKNLSSTVLASPARRPPQSPFKNALKDSPKRGNLASTMERPTPKSLQSPARILFGGSARRGNFGDALGQRPLLSSQSPSKASLFQSPARRPIGSPVKMAAPKTPGKSDLLVPAIGAATASKQVNTFELPDLSNTHTSPVRAARSPGSSVEAQKNTILEQDTAPEQADLTSNNADSPVEESQASSNLPSNADLDVPKKSVVHASNSDDDSHALSKAEETAAKDCQNSDDPGSAEKFTENTQDSRSTTPPDPSPFFAAPAYTSIFPIPRDNAVESDFEDELASPQKSYAPTPLRKFGVSTKDFSMPSDTRAIGTANTFKSSNEKQPAQGTPHCSSRSTRENNASSMTPLAVQLSSWLASSPEKQNSSRRPGQGRGIFSPREQVVVESPPKSSFFEDQMAMHDEQSDQTMSAIDFNEEDCMEMQTSQGSHASPAPEVFGDENALPIDPLLLEAELIADHTLTCTPAKVFSEQPREIHTVSKVPLRPAGEESPRKVPRNRSKSLVGPLAIINTPTRPNAGRSSTVISKSQDAKSFQNVEQGRDLFNVATPTKLTSENPQTPKTSDFSIAGTPLGTNIIPDVLKGAVVYVDVHTTEGADASGIFVELLTQMGARCVKQWLWNPRASMAGNPEDELEPSDTSTPGGKIGITHVVYKDGGKRTLEKVRDSKGVVLCVGVGWVLE